jgi:two-component system, OmpR family, alkaline phosphatase synthesis response regulator PhoP
MRILVTDDDKAILKLLEYKLQTSGFDVITAQNDEEFRQKALTEKPDLLILDIWLGNQNGALLYDEVLARGFDPQIPVIFLTALAQDRPQTPASSGRKYILRGKPFDPDALIKEINELIRP